MTLGVSFGIFLCQCVRCSYGLYQLGWNEIRKWTTKTEQIYIITRDNSVKFEKGSRYAPKHIGMHYHSLFARDHPVNKLSIESLDSLHMWKTVLTHKNLDDGVAVFRLHFGLVERGNKNNIYINSRDISLEKWTSLLTRLSLHHTYHRTCCIREICRVSSP